MEELLAGGNMNAGVVKIGDTVRRPAGPWTPSVHALLEHLQSVGYPAPKPLGLDSLGREVLEFVPGAVRDAMEPDHALVRVAWLIRDFHDAVASFVPPADATWQVLIPADGAEIIAHHDLAPWNLVVGEQRWAFIDWDVAAPGTRLWDLALSAQSFAPLADHVPTATSARRLRLFVNAYGLDEAERHALLGLLAPRCWAMHDFLAAQAALGTQPWTRLWHEGHGVSWRGFAEHITRHESVWARALLD
ncbi:phosphotransferase [Kibdelosporangium philippinense]|uniref:Phosphotransferase n=1 Tax=Kibdelosporangium philippinense TaxID=211113 RepID=A0ABS8Z7M9_9PSEU|nr:phosphotransferase [Kibdelosporangium philippinense]MCE7003891.1 phosphotransferase [Kibdelosporangium philippinense]